MPTDPPALPAEPGGVVAQRQVLPGDASALRAARSVVEQSAHGLLSDRSLDDALLLTSELVANAVMHGASPIVLQVLRRSDSIAVAVTDGLDAWPDTLPGAGRQPAVGGRGLALVAALASSWGVDRHGGPAGKTVWFELRTSRTTPQPPPGGPLPGQ